MKIQIIDDEPIHNFITTRLLRQIAPQLELLEFIDPAEAFANLKTVRPDLILLDLNMPKLNGWEFLDKMGDEGLTNEVVILTSSVSHYDHTKAREYKNVLECVEKPIKKEKLQAIINHLQ